MNPFNMSEVQEIVKAKNEISNKTKAFENNGRETKETKKIKTSNFAHRF